MAPEGGDTQREKIGARGWRHAEGGDWQGLVRETEVYIDLGAGDHPKSVL